MDTPDDSGPIRAQDTARPEAPRSLSQPARTALAALSRADRNMRDIDTGITGISQAVATFANLVGSIAWAANDARDTFTRLLWAADEDATALAAARFEIAVLASNLEVAHAEAKRQKALAETESRLRIEDAQRHAAEIAKAQEKAAAMAQMVDDRQATIAERERRIKELNSRLAVSAERTATPPKAKAAKKPKKEIVLDPDGHPVLSDAQRRRQSAARAKPAAKKAR